MSFTMVLRRGTTLGDEKKRTLKENRSTCARASQDVEISKNKRLLKRIAKDETLTWSYRLNLSRKSKEKERD